MNALGRTVASMLMGCVAVTALAADPPQPPPPPPPAPPGSGALMASCRQDIELLCPGIAPGGDRLKACFQANFRALSPGCKAAVRERRQERALAPAPAPVTAYGPTSPPPPPPPPPPPSAPPAPQAPHG